MNLQDFDKEYENITIARKRDFFRRVFNVIVENIEEEAFEELILEGLLPVLINFESQDGFGTEGIDA